MNKVTYALATGALITLLSAGTAFADEHSFLGLGLGSGAQVNANEDASASAQANDNNENEGFGAIVRILAHEHAGTSASTSPLGLHVSALAHERNEQGEQSEQNESTGEMNERDMHGTTTSPFSLAAAGTVNAVNGTSFTLVPVRGGATTTVTTNASTTFRAHGHATTSAALQAGSNVLVFGTTSGTTTPNTIMASLVIIVQDLVGFWAHVFGH